MAYANAKGSDGEREFAGFLTSVLASYGFKFVRIGNTEKGKKLLHGDVILDYRTDPKELCFLRNYFLEAKKRGTLNLFEIMQEAENNADTYNFHGAIVYAVRQRKGKRSGRAGNSEKLIVMRPETFGRMLQEIQDSRIAFRNGGSI